jgi:YD repeat-containing protein
MSVNPRVSLANITYRYDDDGYLIEKVTPEGTTTYTYNTLGALTRVELPDGRTTEYLQDALIPKTISQMRI